MPVGFLATVTRGHGRRGADRDGRPARPARSASPTTACRSRSARVMRRRSSTSAWSAADRAARGGPRALRPAASMHEGEVSAALGIAGIPSVSESTMIARDCALAAYEEARIHVQHLSAARVGRGDRRARRRAGVRVTCEATPHHLTLTDEEVRCLDSRFKMNPPLRTEADRQALIDGLRDGTIDCIATDHAPHAADEKEMPVRGGADGRHRARDRVRRALHRPRAARASSTLSCWSSAWAAAPSRSASPAPDRHGRAGEPRAVRPRRRVGGRARRAGRAARQLLLRRRGAARPGADHGRRRRGRIPRSAPSRWWLPA